MKGTQRWTRGALLAALVAAVPQVGMAQVTTGGITGRVSDDAGEPVPGATVEVLSVATGLRHVLPVRPTGTYLVQGLEPGGPYRVSVRAIGFQPSVREGVTVLLSQNVRVDVVLGRQAVELEAVVVHGTGDADFTPARQGAQTTITDSLLRRLPTIDRDFTDFVKLTPQVTVREGEGGVSAVGQNNRFNTIQVDGSTVNDRFGLGRTGQAGGQADGRSVGIEAVKEYQILLSPYDVRQGNFTGALINAVTKNGTNDFKGSAFAYRRQENWAGFPVDQRDLSNTQWGFSFGGPIQRDRLHFFTNVEGREDKQPAPGPFFGSAVDPVVARPADVAAFDARLRALGLSGGNFDAVDLERPLTNVLARIDYRVSNSSRLVAKFQYNYAARDIFSRSTFLSNPTLELNNNGYYFRNDTYNPSLQFFTQFANGASNEAIVSLNRIRDKRTPFVLEPLVLVQNYFQASGTGIYSLRSGSEEFSQGNQLEQDIWEFTDNFTLPVAAHHLTFGARLELYKVRNLFAQQSYGLFQFDNQAAFDAGTVEQYNIRVQLPGTPGGDTRFRGGQVALYAQDDWTISPRLTLNPGIRFDLPYFTTSLAYDPRVITDFGPQDEPGGQVMVSPRLGFHFDPRADGVTQVRGGLGLFTGAPAFVWYSNAYANNGLGLVGLQCGGTSGLGPPPAFNPDNVTNPITACTNGATVGAGGSIGEVDLVAQDTKFPQVFRANLAVDRRLPYGFIGTLEGIYSKDVNQFFIVNRNLPQSTTVDQRTGRVLYGTLGITGTVTPTFFRTYYGGGSGGVYELRNTSEGYAWNIAGTLRKSFGTSLQASVSYVYAKAYDVQSFTSSRAISNWRFSRINSGDDQVDTRTLSSFSRPHRVVGSVSYAVPWKLGTDVSLTYVGQSGQPYTLTTTGSSGRGDLNRNGNNGDDPIYIPTGVGDPNGYVFSVASEEQAFNEYISGEECLERQRGRIMERNSCRNPWQNQLDMSIRQNLPVWRGRASLELQIFNVLRMIDRDWGQVKSAAPDEFFAASVLTVTDATDDATESARREIVTFNTALLAQRFRPVSSFASINRSAYYIQAGVRYAF